LRAAVLKVDVGCPASGRQAFVVVQPAAGDVDSFMSQSHRILARWIRPNTVLWHKIVQNCVNYRRIALNCIELHWVALMHCLLELR
jgi:hypothetical protein